MAIPYRIVDAHHHLWDLQENTYPWLRDGNPHPMFGEDYEILRKSYLIADYLADIGDLPVRKSVHLQADHDTSDPVNETRWLNDIAESAPSEGFPHAIVAYADFSSPSVGKILEQHSEYRRVVGIRQTLHHREGRPLDNPQWLNGFSLLRNYSLTFDLQIYPHQLEEALSLVDSHSDIRFILAHSGLPKDRTLDGITEWKKSITAFSTRENVMCKMSGFGMLLHDWRLDDLDYLILFIMEKFGTKRCFFGSNFPVDRFGGSYLKLWEGFFYVTRHMSETELDDMYWNNPIDWYRITSTITGS